MNIILYYASYPGWERETPQLPQLIYYYLITPTFNNHRSQQISLFGPQIQGLFEVKPFGFHDIYKDLSFDK